MTNEPKADIARVALVSMPWASVWVPSIQLAVLRQCLDGRAHTDTYELYVDFAARISPGLYKRLSESLGFAEEWIFADAYFAAEGYEYAERYPNIAFPLIGVGDGESERRLLEALAEVAAEYVEDMVSSNDWGRYDIVAFSLTISQTAASMAMARAIRRKHPQVRIVFGGSSCAGPAAESLLRICPYVDVVVRSEAEGVFAELVGRLAEGGRLDDLRGVSFRDRGGEIRSTLLDALHGFTRRRSYSNFDAYFERLERAGLPQSPEIMLPFESSRGCWWGEKSQCTFCGLAETMKYRVRDPGDVLAELEWLYERHGVRRFFATDLIMPQTYYRDFLPLLAARDAGFEFYYELKGNVTRAQVELLAQAGVVLVQPGLESLSTDVLGLIRKGLTATQNVSFLKWAREYGLAVSWNIIIGVPGENPRQNDAVAAALPTLWHLPPPFVVEFELTRFSPIFDDPEAFGLSNVKPVGLYRAVFPVGDELLGSLVYRFEYDSIHFGGRPPWMTPGADTYAAALQQAIEDWRVAYSLGASLTLEVLEEGGALIRDARGHDRSAGEITHVLSAAEYEFYSFLDSPRAENSLPTLFANHSPNEYATLGCASGLLRLLERWTELRVTFRESGRLVAVAVAAGRTRAPETRAADATTRAEQYA